ncbi:MAG: PilW family protein [Gammaproteobacteria bacterium]
MNYSDNSMNTFSHQRGITLVELMVALVVSLILLAGVIQIFSSNQATYRLQEALSRLQENGRFAIEHLQKDIRIAGFPGNAFAGNAIQGCDRETEACANGNAGDTITVSYQSAVDCLEQATPAGTAVNTYYIQNANLMCLGNGSVTPQLLVEGIEGMQILYGEDLDNDADANHYVVASFPGPPMLNMNNVTSVRVTLVARTIEDNVASAVNNGDKRIRHTFTTTATLRNKAG